MEPRTLQMADKHPSPEMLLQTKDDRHSLVSLQGILCNKVTTLSHTGMCLRTESTIPQKRRALLCQYKD